MNITTAAQKPVSEFLKVAQELVTEVREWANVLWVRVQGLRPRFVSKKVVAKKMTVKQEINLTIRQIVQNAIDWNVNVKKRDLSKVDIEKTVSAIEDILYGDTKYHSQTPGLKSTKISGLLGGYADRLIDEIAARATAYNNKIISSQDHRDQTEKALDSMYGKGGWDARDREDYEG